ncbi:MAG: alpha/beta hydrolase [Lentisphaerae bacterium]|nr:alpha/beta hydrolase [Lentisphaerota bacterium]
MKIHLGETIQDQSCTIEYFLHPEGGERGMVIVFPGGGYAFLSPHEAVPVAEKFVQLGFHAAVCMYRVAPVTYPTQLEDARNAVKYTREHAAELGVKPDKIAVLGFSAGGHLAAMVSNMPGEAVSRPDASILCYPVLSALTENAHLGSYNNLFGNNLPPNEYRDFSWPEVAHRNTPPTFIWHTAPDTTVPVENSIEYFLKLKKLNIHTELHIYPQGNHGLGLGDRPGMEGMFDWIKSWPELCARFLRDLEW